MKNISLKLLVGVIVFGVIALLVATPSPNKTASGSKVATSYNAEGDEFDAMIASHSIIKRILKSPSSAEFPAKQEHQFFAAQGTWKVSGYVDSQNAFGVMIRSHWVVGLVYDAGKYYPAFVEFDGKRVYPSN